MLKKSWLENQLVGVPEALAKQLRSAPDDLASASVEALERAEDTSAGRPNPPGTFNESGAPVDPVEVRDPSTRGEPLLVADALITYACEQALESPDPDALWATLIERIGRGRT